MSLRPSKRRFASWTIALLLPICAAGAARIVIESQGDYQKSRNDFLQREIAKVDRFLVELRGLEDLKEQLLARARIIQQLTRSGDNALSLLETLSRTPSGVALERVESRNGGLEVSGTAYSLRHVSAVVRELGTLPFLGDPQLVSMKESLDGGTRRFRITARASEGGNDD